MRDCVGDLACCGLGGEYVSRRRLQLSPRRSFITYLLLLVSLSVKYIDTKRLNRDSPPETPAAKGRLSISPKLPRLSFNRAEIFKVCIHLLWYHPFGRVIPIPHLPINLPLTQPPPGPPLQSSHLHSLQHHLINPSAPILSPPRISAATSTFKGLSTSGYDSS